MTISHSTKIRSVGGASALAISAAFAVPAIAQSATAPLAAPPAAPTAPTQPGNTEQCVEATPGNFVCAPGTDPDGVGEDPLAGDPADPITVTVQDGSFVTGSTGFASGASVTGDIGTVVTNDGSIVGGANGALILNDDSTFTNNGWTSSDFTVGIRTNSNVDITNTGTIYGNSSVALISGFDGTTLTNSGLIQNDTGQVLRVGGDGLATTTATVINEVTGQIFTTADNSDVLSFGERATITNDGLIQSFGDGSDVIDVSGVLTLTNNGNLAANGDNLVVVRSGEGSSITNNGLIQTTGDGALAIVTGEGSTVVNTGTIVSDNASFNGTVVTGDNSTIDNSGSITVNGDSQAAVLTNSGSTLNNDGAIVAAGSDNTFAVLGNAGGSGSDITINNGSSGTISAAGGTTISSAIFLGGTGNVVNNDGVIDSTGDSTPAITIGADGAINNTGLIEATGADSDAIVANGAIDLTNDGDIVSADASALSATGIAGVSVVNTGTMSGRIITIVAGDDLTIDNSGVIEATDTVAIFTTSGLSLVNTGDITSDRRAIRATDGATIENRGGNIIAGTSEAIILGGAGTVFNGAGGLISGTTALDFTFSGELQQVFNAGTIEGTGGTAALLGGGNDAVWAIDGGDAIGTVDGGAGADSLIVIVSSDQDTTFDLSLFGTQYTNFERLAAGTQNFNQFDQSATAGTGTLTLVGQADTDLIVRNRVTLDGTLGGTARLIAINNPMGDLANPLNFVVGANGLIDTTGVVAIETFTSGYTIDVVGTVQSDASDAISSSNGVTINNSGTIISTSSGTGLDAGVLFTGGTEASTVTNEAGGVIEGDIAVFADITDTGDQLVANFGTITGRIGEAVVLNNGDDEYQHWTGAFTDGNVRFGAGDDVFVLEGSLSTINGVVAGQAGNDTAILGGILDADNLVQFEANELGTLFDLRVSGDRTLTGETTFVGNTIFALGVDTLTIDGNATAASGSTITILTPLDEALLGQTVTVFTETGTFTDNGVTIDIIDDDLLLDYTPVLGSLSVTVNAVNPLVGSTDPNLARVGAAVQNAVTSGTLSSANLDALNALSLDQYQAALLDSLPSISEGPGREIFETSSVASDALERHLAGEGSGIWGQFVVRGADQDALSLSSPGYEADELVFTVGGDFAVGENAKVGLLASYSDIDIDEKQANSSGENLEVESIKLGGYVAISLLERGFFNAEVAYLTGNVETSRTGLLGTITSGFDFDGITGRATLGYDLLPDENVWLTPSIGVNAARLNFDDVTEAGGFGFTIERGDAEFIELRGGVELGGQISEMVDGFIKGTVIYDTVDTPRSFRLSSSQLNTFQLNLPMREQNRFELAAGLNVDVSENFAIGVGYLGDFNDGYNVHAGRATLSIGF
ncbi:autotransporter domain-containing protein [Erythrobacter sp. THAF29]|uniref:autotransporter domain-containing protein n=1 Tax=Erythrobacter sp. THAF29 TaxID=2587851 RepID=UPI0012A8BCDB|nr:autotransporter outer membrane beta-barrel domain-containing protein [Erythrobacter sp. THAF29]QFT77096.1 Autotransporter beta-domain protein [Erythrobacter sp. THAF29]